MQIHRLSTVLEDQGIAPPTFYYLAPKHFHFARTRASHLESVSLCSFGAIILYRGKYNIITHVNLLILLILSVKIRFLSQKNVQVFKSKF